MDPNEVLEELREWAKGMPFDNPSGAESVSEVEAARMFTLLDESLSNGGTLPAGWNRAIPAGSHRDYRGVVWPREG